jgi:hypothetical protein
VADNSTEEKVTIPQLVRSSPVPVSDSTIRLAVREQRLPAEMILGKYRIAPADYLDFLHGVPRTSRP